MMSNLSEKVAAYPWYLSDELLMALSLFIAGCGVYLPVSYWRRSQDGDDQSGPSKSGLSRTEIYIYRERERERERERYIQMILRLLSCRRRATEILSGHSRRHFDLGIWTAGRGRPHFSCLSFSTASLSLFDVSSGGNGFLEEGADDSFHYENLKIPEAMQSGGKNFIDEGPDDSIHYENLKSPEAMQSGLETKVSSAAPQGIYKAILIGEAGHTPSQKILKNGSTVTLFSLGTSGMRNNRKPYENETPDQYARRSSVQWHRIAIYQFRLGALAIKSVKKGSQVYVEGNLETRVFLEPESNSIKHVQEIAVRQNGRIIFLDQNKAKV